MIKDDDKEVAAEDTAAEEGVGFEDSGASGEGEPLVVNLADYDENAVTEVLPQGSYNCIISGMEFKHSQRSGNPMWELELEIEDGDYAGRKFWTHITWDEKSRNRSKKALIDIGQSELANSSFSPEDKAAEGVLIGIHVTTSVKIGTYQGRKNNQVRGMVLAGGTGEFAAG